jgi:hypothetical protein
MSFAARASGLSEDFLENIPIYISPSSGSVTFHTLKGICLARATVRRDFTFKVINERFDALDL